MIAPCGALHCLEAVKQWAVHEHKSLPICIHSQCRERQDGEIIFQDKLKVFRTLIFLNVCLVFYQSKKNVYFIFHDTLFSILPISSSPLCSKHNQVLPLLLPVRFFSYNSKQNKRLLPSSHSMWDSPWWTCPTETGRCCVELARPLTQYDTVTPGSLSRARRFSHPRPRGRKRSRKSIDTSTDVTSVKSF